MWGVWRTNNSIGPPNCSLSTMFPLSLQAYAGVRLRPPRALFDRTGLYQTCAVFFLLHGKQICEATSQSAHGRLWHMELWRRPTHVFCRTLALRVCKLNLTLTSRLARLAWARITGCGSTMAMQHAWTSWNLQKAIKWTHADAQGSGQGLKHSEYLQAWSELPLDASCSSTLVPENSDPHLPPVAQLISGRLARLQSGL